MNEKTYPCIACAKPCTVELSDDGTEIDLMHGCVACEGQPLYGSAAYDPLPGDPFLTAFVCDGCFKKARKEGKMFADERKALELRAAWGFHEGTKANLITGEPVKVETFAAQEGM